MQTSLKEIEDVRFKKIVLMTAYEIDLCRTSGRIGCLELDKTKTRMSFLPLKVNSLASSKMKIGSLPKATEDGMRDQPYGF